MDAAGIDWELSAVRLKVKLLCLYTAHPNSIMQIAHKTKSMYNVYQDNECANFFNQKLAQNCNRLFCLISIRATNLKGGLVVNSGGPASQKSHEVYTRLPVNNGRTNITIRRNG